jgi:diketogulonate reductase-like aldo/keto reductase
VGNLDTDDMEELAALPGGEACATNQVLYNLTRRGIEWDLLPWCREHTIPIMAYSPIEQGRLLRKSALKEVADRYGATPAQVALAWVMRDPLVIAIPKAGDESHIRENRMALEIRLTAQDLAALDRAFPPPTRKQSLELL